MSDQETYGKLREGLHLVGYTFERACSNLETLLEGDRWQLDGRFSDPNAFLDSLRLDEFRSLARPASASRGASKSCNLASAIGKSAGRSASTKRPSAGCCV